MFVKFLPSDATFPRMIAGISTGCSSNSAHNTILDSAGCKHRPASGMAITGRIQCDHRYSWKFHEVSSLYLLSHTCEFVGCCPIPHPLCLLSLIYILVQKHHLYCY